MITMTERLQKALKSIQEKVLIEGKRNIQTFISRNTAGDYMETIHDEDGIQVDYCEGWAYIEVFGLTLEETKALYSQTFIYYTSPYEDKSYVDRICMK